jgi:hypothetical protein
MVTLIIREMGFVPGKPDTTAANEGKVSGYPLNIDTSYNDTIERNWYTKNWMKKALQ